MGGFDPRKISYQQQQCTMTSQVIHHLDSPIPNVICCGPTSSLERPFREVATILMEYVLPAVRPGIETPLIFELGTPLDPLLLPLS